MRDVQRSEYSAIENVRARRNGCGGVMVTVMSRKLAIVCTQWEHSYSRTLDMSGQTCRCKGPPRAVRASYFERELT